MAGQGLGRTPPELLNSGGPPGTRGIDAGQPDAETHKDSQTWTTPTTTTWS